MNTTYKSKDRKPHRHDHKPKPSPALVMDMDMDALVLDPTRCTAVLEKMQVPLQGSFEITVRVEAVSLNPIDPLYVQHPLSNSKRTIGSDFAGTIISVGEHVPDTNNLRIGDAVSGFLQGACSVNARPGAFAEYLVIPWDLIWKIPDCLSIAQAAGVSLVALTAAQAIWYRLGLKAPFTYDEDNVLAEHPEWAASRKRVPTASINVFIYGASTSVGLFAAQMVHISAKASGQAIRLFGAASKARWEMLQSEPYCHEQLVDYHDNHWLQEALNLMDGKGVQYAYDCISEGSSVEKVSSLLGKDGKIAIVRSREGGAWHSAQLPTEPIYGAVWEGLGEEVQYQGLTVPRSQAARQFAVQFYDWLGRRMGSEIKPIPIRLMPGDLEKIVEDGFELLGSGKMNDRATSRFEDWMRPVSAEKLVYTPWSSA